MKIMLDRCRFWVNAMLRETLRNGFEMPYHSTIQLLGSLQFPIHIEFERTDSDSLYKIGTELRDRVGHFKILDLNVPNEDEDEVQFYDDYRESQTGIIIELRLLVWPSSEYLVQSRQDCDPAPSTSKDYLTD